MYVSTLDKNVNMGDLTSMNKFNEVKLCVLNRRKILNFQNKVIAVHIKNKTKNRQTVNLKKIN